MLILLLLTGGVFPLPEVCAESGEPLPGAILIISSYNSETQSTLKYVGDFEDEYSSHNGKYEIILRPMNSQSFSEASIWVPKMREILTDVMSKTKVELIILLGQEAWAAYLSQKENLLKGVPVMGGMVSRNAIFLPDEKVGPSWEAQSIDVIEELGDQLVFSGFMYDYNIEPNLRLILDFFPDTRHVALITDNSYGGVSLQALVREKIKLFPGLDLISLDGRRNDLKAISRQVEELPDHTVFLLGTWRVDANDYFYARFPAYDLLGDRKHPVFTLTTLGLTFGAIGGFVPQYKDVAREMAHKALSLEGNEKFWLERMEFHQIPNEYVFDWDMLVKYNLQDKKVVKTARIENPKQSFFKAYRYEIFGVLAVILVLLLALAVALFIFVRTKRLKDALEEMQKDNELILNNINVGIRFVNPDYTVKWHNGIDPLSTPERLAKAKNKVCYELLHGRTQPCDFCPIPLQMKNGAADYETTVCTEDNQFIHIYSRRVNDDAGLLLGYVMRLEDVTKQKQSEIELRMAKEKAEESDRLKSAFLANMSHEIRTPLNAIVGFSSVLISEEDCDEEMRQEYSQIIRKNSDLLLRLINDILDISRLETGKIRLTYGEFDVVDVCRNVLATTEHAKPPGVEYVLNAPHECLMIRTDVQRLQQILINLLSNANKFTTDGTITLSYWLEPAEGRIYFSVTDTGCGIPVGDAQKVFGRFEKLNEYAQGTGLGLAISKITINRMGGDIWVDESYREGARFVFYQPLVPKEEA